VSATLDGLPDEVQESIRAKATPAHLAMHYTRDMPDEVKWRPYKHLMYLNRKLVEAVTSPEQTFLNIAMSVRHGKALDVDTPIPTPDGWTPMGELDIGDVVFDETGQPVRVVEAFDPYDVDDAYEVRFSDGSRIVTDAPHQWVTYSYREAQALGSWRRRNGLPNREWPSDWATGTDRSIARTPKVRTTAELTGEWHGIPTAGPLDCPTAVLPIDPYVLGVWLGDGTAAGGSVTTADEAVIERIRAAGYRVEHRPSYGPYGYWVFGLQAQLKALGVFRDKHIPASYLRAGAAQRLDLLRGLMDSDGGVERSRRNTGRVSFTNQNKRLADAVAELFVSLGAKVTRDERPSSLGGRLTGATAYRASTSPPFCPFHLSRKADSWADDSKGSLTRRTRVVREVVRCGPRRVRCVAVDSPSHLYLAGEAMIPTHNSELISRYLVVWFLGMFPDRQVIIISYNQEKAAEWGQYTRDVMKQIGPKLFGLTVDSSSDSKTNWKIKGHRGGVMAVGADGTLAGVGGHLIVIDDPIKNRGEADSETIRSSMFTNYGGNIRTRLMPGGTMILTMARWHEDDLTGQIEANTREGGDPWEFLNFPAIAEAPADADSATWRDALGRADGDALWPEVWPGDRLRQIEASIDPSDWDSLYQQHPSSKEGGMFRVDAWNYISPSEAARLKPYMRLCRFWDTAASKRKGDWTVGALVGILPDKRVFVFPPQRFREDPHVVKQRIKTAAIGDGQMVPIRMEQERAGAGKTVIADYKLELLGWDFDGVRAEGSKEQRAKPFASQQGIGNVYLVGDEQDEWCQAWVEEYRTFPTGRHDDQVDAGSGAFNYLSAMPPIEMPDPSQLVELPIAQMAMAGVPGMTGGGLLDAIMGRGDHGFTRAGPPIG